MTKEDIEKMRAFDPELTSKLENGITIKAPKHMELFHDYEKLDNKSKLVLYNLITNDLYSTGVLERSR